MASIVESTWETYKEHISLVLLFSIPFIIAFAIPALAPLPTYISAGAIFLRSASIFVNLSVTSLAVIVLGIVLSLLFISFAFVAISLIVKAEKTHVKTPGKVMRGIEGYTAKVFTVLLAYMIVLAVTNIVGYYLGVSDMLTAVVGFFGFALIFYAPSAIVVDDKRIWRAVKDSAKLMAGAPQYFMLWLTLITVTVSVLDFVLIALSGTLFSQYILLVVNSLFVLPYFIIFQAEAYMRKFPMLRR